MRKVKKVEKRCPSCRGSGQTKGKRCSTCNGYGTVTTWKRVA